MIAFLMGQTCKHNPAGTNIKDPNKALSHPRTFALCGYSSGDCDCTGHAVRTDTLWPDTLSHADGHPQRNLNTRQNFISVAEISYCSSTMYPALQG